MWWDWEKSASFIREKMVREHIIMFSWKSGKPRSKRKVLVVLIICDNFNEEKKTLMVKKYNWSLNNIFESK